MNTPLPSFQRRDWMTGLCLVLLLTSTLAAWAQPSVLGSQVANGNYATYNLTDLGTFRQVRILATSAGVTGTRSWEFTRGTVSSPDYITNWRSYTSGLTLAGYNQAIAPVGGTASALYNTSGGGQSGLLPAVASGSTYTFNISKNGAADNTMAVLQTAFTPVDIMSVSREPAAPPSSVAVTLNATFSATPNAAEYFYVRYSLDNFATSSFVAFGTSGSTRTATIPAQALPAGQFVRYYVFSSPVATVATFTNANADMLTLNLNNAGGNNYRYDYSGAGLMSGSYFINDGATNFTTGGGVNFNSFREAFNALNAYGIGGAVVFNVKRGLVYSEGRLVLNAVQGATSTRTLTFQPDAGSSGNNPAISPTVAGIGTNDAVVALNGADFVTFDQIGLQENTANTNSTSQYEFGYALFRASATDGSQNNEIKGAFIFMSKAGNPATTGAIYGSPVYYGSTAPGSLVLTNATGSNSNNKFNGNTVSALASPALAGAQTGIYLNGNLTGITFYDTGNEIGSTTGNTISDVGGGTATTQGIRSEYQTNLKIENNTITVPTGTTGSTTVAGINVGISSGAGVTGTLTINNNTISVSTASTGSVGGIRQLGTSNLTALSITNNKVQNCNFSGATAGVSYIQDASSAAGLTSSTTGNQVISNTTASTGTVICINRTGGSGTATISGNFIGVTSGGATAANSVTGAAGTTYGIQFATSAVTVNNNRIANLSYTNTSGVSSSTLYGIYTSSGATPVTITNNVITGLSILGATTSTGNMLTGIYSDPSATNVGNFTGNAVGGLVIGSSGTAPSGTVTGMSLFYGSTTTAPVVSQNKVFDLTAFGASGSVTGFLAGTNFLGTISNNLVGDLRAPQASGLLAVTGLNLAGGSGPYNVYYNTLNLAASSSAATFGTSGIFFTNAAAPILNLRNNIVVNTSTAAGAGGLTAALRRSGGTAGTVPANYPTTSNNNLFWSGTPSATNLIYVEGTATATNAQQTLAAYKAFMVTRDQASVSENPPLLSTTGSAATFLHINPAVATQVESGGAAIAGITTDFDGDTRNATTPDIGADEGAFTPSDQTPPTIVYAALSSTGSTANRTLTATITDASGVATGAGAPRIYYRKGATGAYFSALATAVVGSVYTFTIDYANVGGTPVVGDVFQYYVAAQDLPGNAGTSPGGGTGTNPPGSTAPGTPNQYTVLPTLSAGNYYVGTSAHTPPATYATLTAAAAAYNGSGLAGAINFILIDPTYSTAETFPITFNANGDASAANRLTISPEAGVNATVSGSNTTALLLLNGADYVTLDGSNNATTTRNLTLANAGGTTVLLSGASAGGGATNDVLRNLNITASASTSGIGISVGGATGGTTGADNDNVTIQNNSIQQAFAGIYVGGTAAVSAGGADGLSIVGNVVGPVASGSGNIGSVGLFMANAVAPSVTGNTVQNISLTTAGGLTVGMNFSTGVSNATVTGNTISGVTVTAGSYDALGLNLGTGFTGGTVDRNKILNIVSNTSSYGGRGIDISTGSATSNLRISNNFVAGINGSGWSGLTSDAIVGIRILGTTGGVSLYYNSVSLSGSYSAASASVYQSAALYVASTVTALDVRDNVFANTLVNGTSASKAYAFYSSAPKAAFTTISYNDYFVGVGPQALLGNLGGAGAPVGTTGDMTTLAAFQATTGTGQDVNSLVVDPSFASATDLHTSAPALNAAATPIASITTDLDGDTRDAATPDLGADEFTPSTLDLRPTALAAPAAGQTCFSSAEPVTVTIQNNASSLVDFAANAATVTVSVTGAATQTFTTTLSSGTLGAGATQNVTLPGTLNMTALGTYSFAVTATVTGDANMANDVLTPAPTRTNAAPQAALPYAESFNGSALPTSFTTTGFSTSTAANNGGATGSRGLRVNIYSTNTSAIATTPVLGTTSSSDNVLTFDARFTDFTSGAGQLLSGNDRVDVQVAICGGAFATVFTINGTNQNGTGTGSANFFTYSVPLTGVGAGQKIQVRLAAAYGGSSGSDFYVDLDNISVRSVFATDLAPTALVAPTTTQGCYGPAETVTVTVKNQGTTALDFATNPATVTVNVTGAATATLTGGITTGTLAPGATQNVTLAPTLNMSTTTGTYTFAIAATVTGDQNPANDNLTPAPPITTVAPVAGVLSPASAGICQSGTATLALTGAANGSIQYQSSPDNVTFTDIAGATSVVYTTPVLTSTTYYRAQTRCGTNSATSNVATVTVNNPLITGTTNSPVVACAGSAATLTATGSAGTTVRFFAAATGGPALATGTAGAATASYTTPALTASTTYYAEAIVLNGSTSSISPVTNAFGTGVASTAPQYLIFNVAQPITLTGVYVYPGAVGNVVVEYRNTMGVVLQSTTFAVTAAQVNTRTFIPVNFNLVAGTAQRLGLGTGSVSLFRNDAGAGYPYTEGGVSITGNSFDPNYYYYFYNWQVANDCPSTRTAVTVTVNPAATANAGTAPAGVCAGSTYSTTGSYGGSATSATYTSSGTGTFSNGGLIDGTTPSVSYTPSAADITAGTVTLTLTTAGPCAAATATLPLTINSTTTYTGAAPGDGSNWFNTANWTACVPSRTVDALVPGGLANYPVLGAAATSEVRTLTIANGASLAQSAGMLSVYGNLTSSAPAASVSLTGGLVAFLGTMPTITGQLALYDLTVNLSTVSGMLSMTSNATVTHALTLTQGLLNTGAYALTLTPAATILETDASYVLGQVSVPGRSLATAAAESFGNIGLTLTPDAASVAFPGLTTVVRTTGAVLTGVGTSVSIKRYFDIQPAINTGLNVAMDFSYFDHERNGIAAGSVALFKSVSGAGGPWANQSPIVVAGNTVSKAGIADFSVWTLGSSASPLPVELTAFTAGRQGSNAALAWTTASERDSRGFEVQVSTDGRGYRVLEFVASPTASSVAPRAYAYLDREARKAGLRYYRLRQVDLSGAATFSPVRTVHFDGAAALRLMAAPNPFQERLTLTVELPAGLAAASAKVSLTDAAGRTLLAQPTPALPAGQSQLELPGLANLASGVYFVHLTVPGQPTQHLKVVKE